MTHKSMRGKSVDMDTLKLVNEKTVAVGNMKVNARGDRLGKGGQIVKTADKVAQEYYKDNPKATKRLSLKDTVDANLEEIVETPKAAPPKAKAKAKKKDVFNEAGDIIIPESDDELLAEPEIEDEPKDEKKGV